MKKELLASTALAGASTAMVAAVGLTGFGFAGQAEAQTGLYLGGGPSVVAHDGCTGDTCKSDTIISGLELGGKVYAGWQFHKYGAVEAGYNYFGVAEDTDLTEYESHGASLSLIGILPVGAGGDLFFRGGVFFGWLDVQTTDDTPAEAHAFGLSPVVGVGARVDLGSNAALRVEAEYVPNVADGQKTDKTNETTEGDIDIFAFTVSVMWRF